MTLDNGNPPGSFLFTGTGLGNLLRGLDGPWRICMIAQIISMEMGMGVMTGWEVWFFLGVVPGLRMGMVQGMVLIQFFLPSLVRADIRAWRCLGIIRPTIRPVSGCHIQYFWPGNKNAFPQREPGPKRSAVSDAGNVL